MKSAADKSLGLYSRTDTFIPVRVLKALADGAACYIRENRARSFPPFPAIHRERRPTTTDSPEKIRVGFLYMILSLTCFGAIGLLVKFANLKGCRPTAVYAWAFAWCVAFSAAFVMYFRGGQFHVPVAVYAIAVPFGIMSAIGGIVFMAGVRFGKISTSWLIINLSAAIPAVGSIVIYHESVSAKKLAVLALAGVAVLLLWKDKQEDEKRQAEEERVTREMA